jgi:predicted N-formylglutamate amidohydrolase
MSAVVEVIAGGGSPPVVLTCEHASEAVPPGFDWPEADAWLRGTHWAFDLGIADLTRALAQRLGSPAVLAGFSRLLIDPNRPLDAATLFRDQAEGRPVTLNQALAPQERERRIRALYEPYHRTVAEVVAAHPGAPLLSLHSFTPVYEGGPPRPMQLGVLVDEEEALGQAWAVALRREGFVVAVNEPYSGRAGLMYSVDHHARRFSRPCLELEVRQDLAVDDAERPRLVEALARALASIGWG